MTEPALRTSVGVLPLIGATPLVQVRHLDPGPCQPWPKPENLNPASLPPGRSIGRWRLLGQRGRGAYGVVYRAESLEEAPGVVALKLALYPGDARFVREAELLSRVHHPAVPRLFDHSAHLNAKNEKGQSKLPVVDELGQPMVACQNCHGKVDQMEIVSVQQNFNMQWCVDCHRKPEIKASTDCIACHR